MTNIMKRNTGNGAHLAARTTMPFSGLVDNIFQNALDRFFGEDFSGSGNPWPSSRVPVNIRETGTTYEIEVVAPALKKEDFSVHLSKNMLTVSFEHKQQKTEQNESDGYISREYQLQSFSRSFTLDDSIDAAGISAAYKDGVLHVSLPKKEGAQKLTRRIEIQ